MAREPTARQQAVYRFIVEAVNRRGYPPTVREIGEHFRMNSTGSVRDHLTALEKKGFIRRAPHTSRGIELVRVQDRPATETMPVPLLGQIAAGEPLLAEENQEDVLNIDTRFFGRGGELFALRVTGQSMRDAGIYDGDVVFVRRQDHANNGETVAVLINDEATVKRYYHEQDRIRLEPANDAFEPILLTPGEGEVSILGKVVGLARRY